MLLIWAVAILLELGWHVFYMRVPGPWKIQWPGCAPQGYTHAQNITPVQTTWGTHLLGGSVCRSQPPGTCGHNV